MSETFDPKQLQVGDVIDADSRVLMVVRYAGPFWVLVSRDDGTFPEIWNHGDALWNDCHVTRDGQQIFPKPPFEVGNRVGPLGHNRFAPYIIGRIVWDEDEQDWACYGESDGLHAAASELQLMPKWKFKVGDRITSGPRNEDANTCGRTVMSMRWEGGREEVLIKYDDDGSTAWSRADVFRLALEPKWTPKEGEWVEHQEYGAGHVRHAGNDRNTLSVYFLSMKTYLSVPVADLTPYVSGYVVVSTEPQP